jgi:hypothetical protein
VVLPRLGTSVQVRAPEALNIPHSSKVQLFRSVRLLPRMELCVSCAPSTFRERSGCVFTEVDRLAQCQELVCLAVGRSMCGSGFSLLLDRRSLHMRPNVTGNPTMPMAAVMPKLLRWAKMPAREAMMIQTQIASSLNRELGGCSPRRIASARLLVVFGVYSCSRS